MNEKTNYTTQKLSVTSCNIRSKNHKMLLGISVFSREYALKIFMLSYLHGMTICLSVFYCVLLRFPIRPVASLLFDKLYGCGLFDQW